jgi:D-glycero-alpha-D-manno-heptose-7-phosphate kinase
MIKKVRAPVRIDFGGGTTDIKPFTDTHGGAVLNAAINKYVEGEMSSTKKKISLRYSGNIPTSSGLGTSSAMSVVWVALITRLRDKKKIAESVYRIEQSIKESEVNGKQDQYASAFGGINFMEFNGDNIKINPVKMSNKFRDEFENSLVLVYSGKSHYSGISNKSAIDNLLKGRNVSNLISIKNIAIEMKKSLLKKDLEGFAELMNEETKERKKLSKTVVLSQLQKIINKGLKNGGKGAKVCGSGGGGSVLFLGDKKKLKRAFGDKIIDFKFDFKGLRWF